MLGNQIRLQEGMTMGARIKAEVVVASVVAVVLATLVFISLNSAQPGSMPQAKLLAKISPCSSLMVIGLRGSGESYDARTDGMGPEAYTAYSQIKEKVPGAIPYGLPYPAVAVLPLSQLGSPYSQSLSYGDYMLYHYVSQEDAACPHQKIALLGYSQGAQVIGDTLKNFTSAQRGLIAQVLLFGDPRFNPTVDTVDRGNYNPKLSGVFGSRTIASVWYSKLRDYCASRDPICNYSAVNITLCVKNYKDCAHFGYVTSGTAKSAGLLAGDAIAGS
jgi:hypothetical protein